MPKAEIQWFSQGFFELEEGEEPEDIVRALHGVSENDNEIGLQRESLEGGSLLVRIRYDEYKLFPPRDKGEGWLVLKRMS